LRAVQPLVVWSVSSYVKKNHVRPVDMPALIVAGGKAAAGEPREYGVSQRMASILNKYQNGDFLLGFSGTGKLRPPVILLLC
jgi:hypothetical protein